jgi:hypothetical protein
VSTGRGEERAAKPEQTQPRPDGFETIRNCHNDELLTEHDRIKRRMVTEFSTFPPDSSGEGTA